MSYREYMINGKVVRRHLQGHPLRAPDPAIVRQPRLRHRLSAAAHLDTGSSIVS